MRASVSAKRILESRDQHDIERIGPVPVDPSWQARTPGAFGVSQFQVDWDHHVVTCPQGEHSITWHQGKDAKDEWVVQVWFALPACQACPLRVRCTTARATGRSMTLRFPQEAMSCCKRRGRANRRPTSMRCIARVAEWKARSPTRRATRACGERAMSGSARHISSTSSRRWRPISSASSAGSTGPACQNADLALCRSRCRVHSSPTVSPSC
jgi:hypothetical protein